MGLQRRGCREAVGDDVVVPIRAHGAEEPEPMHLDRGRPVHEDLHPCAHRVAAQVDQHLYAVGAYAPYRLLDRLGAHVDEMLERALDALTQRTVLARADRIGVDLEAAAVVPLPEFGQKVGDRMQAKVVRDVTDPQARPARGRNRGGRQQTGALAMDVGEAARDRQLLGCGERQRERVQRDEHVLGALRKLRDMGAHFIDARRPVRPVADHLPRAQQRVNDVSRRRPFPARRKGGVSLPRIGRVRPAPRPG